MMILSAIVQSPSRFRVVVQREQGSDQQIGHPVPVGRLGPIFSFSSCPSLLPIQCGSKPIVLPPSTETQSADEPEYFHADRGPNRLLTSTSLSDGVSNSPSSSAAKAGEASSFTREGGAV